MEADVLTVRSATGWESVYRDLTVVSDECFTATLDGVQLQLCRYYG